MNVTDAVLEPIGSVSADATGAPDPLAVPMPVFRPTWRHRVLLEPWPDGLYRFGGGTERSMEVHLMEGEDHRPTVWQTLGYGYWPDGTWRPCNRLWGTPVGLRE